jgi:TMEM175 potassium channel family protein
MEAFSDGVFAVAATLLVFEFAASPGPKLGTELVHIWPAYFAYVTTFVTIGIIWMNHHHTVSLLGRVDRTMLFINNLLLLTVSFLPFPTKLVAEDLRLQAAHGRPCSPTAAHSS